MRRPPKILPVGSSRSMNGGLPIASQCRISIRERRQLRRKKSAVMIPVRAAQERNTRNAAGLTKRRHRGAHRMVTLKTAKTLNLTLPPTLQVGADQVIE